MSREITDRGKQGHDLSMGHYITLDNSLMDAVVFVPSQNVLVNRYAEIESNRDVHLPDYWKGIHPMKGLKDFLYPNTSSSTPLVLFVFS